MSKSQVKQILIKEDKEGQISIHIKGFNNIEALGILRLYEQAQSINILRQNDPNGIKVRQRKKKVGLSNK